VMPRVDPRGAADADLMPCNSIDANSLSPPRPSPRDEGGGGGGGGRRVVSGAAVPSIARSLARDATRRV